MGNNAPIEVDWRGGTVGACNETLESSSKDAVGEHWRAAYLHAYSLVGNRADAEDLAQEAFLRLFQRQATQKIESYVYWMRRVVRNAVRRNFVETRPDLHVPISHDDDDDPESGIIDPAVSIQEKMIQENLAGEALRILAKLPNTEKDCVMMYARGYSFTQIAKALGMPYERAISTTTRAVIKIRNLIDKFPPTRQVGSVKR